VKNYIKQDPKLMRPTEIDVLAGCSKKAEKNLNWKPKTSFKDIVRIMVKSDIEKIKFGSNESQLNI
ncbi:MAG TPA: GDP-mannose 4,6-dehydratase, partial [Maribacter sp.]|nr:GDP-mannose 4,6-dehydratase [Maribacter sp.]